MSNPEYFRNRAEAYIQKYPSSKDNATRELMLEIAEMYMEMADDLSRRGMSRQVADVINKRIEKER